jgi:hypothetical protein
MDASAHRRADANELGGRFVRPSLTVGLLLTLAALAWGAIVVGFYYPDLVREILHPLAIGRASRLEGLGAITLPDAVSGRYLLRDAWAVVGVGLLAFGALALGAQILRVARLALPGTGEALTRLAVGLGAISMLVLMLGLVHALKPNVLTALVVVLAVNAAVWTWRQRRRLSRLSLERVRLPAPSVMLVLFGLLGLAFLLTALVGALGPEIGFDALWYHLALPRLYLDQGHVFGTPFEFVSLYPQGTEMLYAVGLDWGGARAAKLVDLLFGVLAVLATFRLARRYMSWRFALVAAVVFLAAPTVHWEMTTAYVELAIAFFVTLSITELVDWRTDRDRRHVWRAAILLGLALGTKHLALLFVPPLFAVVLIGLFQDQRAAGASTAKGLGRGTVIGAGFSLAALLVHPRGTCEPHS